MSPARGTLRVGTRCSRLARWQTDRVVEALRARHPELACAIVTISTEGDRDARTPLPEFGAPGVFTGALERALRERTIDFAVHSLKDVPVASSPELVLAAVGFRADPREVLVTSRGWTLATLPAGARVGTCSTRRLAQLSAARPDLVLLPVRGNVETRVRHVGEGRYEAVLLAAAGVLRLGLAGAVSEYLPLASFLPAPGQGALAVQCREDDERVRRLLASIDDADARAATDAERSFLEALGGGCDAPVAAYGVVDRVEDSARLRLWGAAALADGQLLRVASTGSPRQAAALGTSLGRVALDRGAVVRAS